MYTAGSGPVLLVWGSLDLQALHSHGSSDGTAGLHLPGQDNRAAAVCPVLLQDESSDRAQVCTRHRQSIPVNGICACMSRLRRQYCGQRLPGRCTSLPGAACICALTFCTPSRLVIAGRCVSLVCDLGIVLISLLKLYSDTSIPDEVSASGEAAAIQREIAFTFVSCALSVASFLASMIGLRKLLRGMRESLWRSSAGLRRAIGTRVVPVVRCRTSSHCLYGRRCPRYRQHRVGPPRSIFRAANPDLDLNYT